MTESPVAPSASTGPAAAWYADTPEEVASKLGVDPAKGLSADKAAELLAKNGPNALPAEATVPGWKQFLGQYSSYMQIILVAAAVASMLIGEISTGVVVLAITALNALGGMRQQGKAESAMNALQSMLKASARVRRGGAEIKVDGDQVVVGDVVLLTAGDDVCADGRIIEAASLQIDESGLTGESVPASKSAELIARDPKPGVGDQTNMAFMNSPVTHGSGVMLVTGTGADTEVGNISGLLKSTPTLKTPLTAQLDTLTLWIAGAAGLTIAIMFALGISRGQSTQTIFTTAIALALAAVPMAMPTVLQVILSSGSTTLAAHGAVVKNLASVETLGSTSAINSDKTGTLTLNQVTVVEVIDPTDRFEITGMGYGLDGEVKHTAGSTGTIDDAILPFLIANDAKLVDGKVVGDPTEGACSSSATRRSSTSRAPRLRIRGSPPCRSIRPTSSWPSSRTRRTLGQTDRSSLHQGSRPRRDRTGDLGALQRRERPVGGRGEQPGGQGDGTPRRAGTAHHGGGHQGPRPGRLRPRGDLLSLVTGLQMTTMVGMIDPPRAESKDAVRDAQSANIRVRMVTGDDVITGAAIAEQLGIPGEAILGADFAAMSEEERLARIDGIGVVGRVAPEHKVLMVNTLQKKGDVVAMTGDGVNDAPAIKAADIGIAMGTGTEVAKNAGKMILTDDNFATIVRAVSEGRKLYDNMLKYIRFMLVALVTYVVTFLMASLLNIAGGQPFSAVQILWINFLITAPIGIALGLDKETPGLMKRRPRPRAASIMSTPVIVTVGLSGLFMSVAINLLILLGKHEYSSVAIGSTMGLVAFSLMLVVAAVECRDQTGSILRMETLDNNVVNVTILVELALALLIARGGLLTSLLDTQDITGRQWLLGALPAVLLGILWELGKLGARRREESASPQ